MSGENATTDVLSVRFPSDLIGSVKRLAEQDGVTVSAWVRAAINRQLRPSGTEASTPTRREAIDQWLSRWPSMDRAGRVKFAKAYLMDAVQAQADTALSFSTRVNTGVALLREALGGDVCETCHRPKAAA